VILVKKIRQEKYQLLLAFQTHNLRYQIRNTIHEKNHEAHSLKNKILKDEIEKKIQKKS
jgi:hypothetical protein